MTITWQRIPHLCRAHQVMLVDGERNGWWIHAVQHPTALRPYEVHRPNGDGYPEKFSSLKQAKAFLLERFTEENER